MHNKIFVNFIWGIDIIKTDHLDKIQEYYKFVKSI